MAAVETRRAAYSYIAYGLCIHADFPVPELTTGSDRAVPDVFIRMGELPPPPVALPKEGGGIWQTPDGVYFFWREFGTFLIRDGCEIILDMKPDTSLQAMRLPLLGCVLGVLLHQRGLFTLHASAISIEGVAVAFIGAKQAGKSTIAATLHARGHALIVDDVLALDLRNEDIIRALPGFPQFKLWPASATALGEDPASLAPLHPELEKRALRPENGFQKTSLPLSRIYVLSEGPKLASEQLSAREAFMQLISHSYAARFLGEAGAGPEHFQQCQDLVQQVPVCLLHRPRDLSLLPEIGYLVENEVRQAS